VRDALATVRTYLATIAGITAITGTGKRLVAGPNLPAGYKPQDGSALLFNVRSGSQDYTSGMLNPSIQFRSYGGFDEGERVMQGNAAAWALDQALYDGVNDKTYEAGNIAFFRLEDGTFPVLLNEPGTDWPYVLSFYRVHIRNN